MRSPATAIPRYSIGVLAGVTMLAVLGSAWAAGSDCRRCSTNLQVSCSDDVPCLSSCPPGTCQPLAKTKPNIVLFIADDLGWADLPTFSGSGHHLYTRLPADQQASCLAANPTCQEVSLLDPVNQCPRCLTPNLDQLARDGVKFQYFYAGAPLCAPSRASMMTGRYGRRTGVTANESLSGLAPVEQTFAEHLRSGCATAQAGVCYTTGLMGKWHNGWSAKAPYNQGFDEVVGFTQSQNQLRRPKWQCFKAKKQGDPVVHLLTDPAAAPGQGIGPALLRLDPTLSLDVCADVGAKDGHGEMTVPANAECLPVPPVTVWPPPPGTKWACGGGSLPCHGENSEEDCPFYGCVGTCQNNGNPCLTDANCCPHSDPNYPDCTTPHQCVHTSCTGSTRFGDPSESQVADIVIQDQRFSTWVQRDLAVSFIRRHRNDACPYLLVVPLRAPHAPTKGPFDRDRFTYVTGEKKWERSTWAAIQDLDTLVGDVVAEATTNDTNPQKTLILFLSDNGKKHGSSPLSGSKFQVEEGGIRVGLIARWDGPDALHPRIAHGAEVLTRIGQTNDLLPTLADAAGAPLGEWDTNNPPAERCLKILRNNTTTARVDGRSLLPILTATNPDSVLDPHDFMFFGFEGEAARSRTEFYNSTGYGCSAYAASTSGHCAPDGNGSWCAGLPAAWKLASEGGGVRLYDINRDPGEEHDCLHPAGGGPPAQSLRMVARDLCRRLKYWEKHASQDDRCVENVEKGDLPTDECLPEDLEDGLPPG